MLNQVQHDEDERLRWVFGSDRRQPGARNGPENRRAATFDGREHRKPQGTPFSQPRLAAI
jgi:hypothetical protein